MVDGSGKLSYNDCLFGRKTRDGRSYAPSNFAPPGGVGFRRCYSTEQETSIFDKNSPNLSQTEIYDEPGDVHVDEFRQNMFHGSGVYQFEDPDSGHTAGYASLARKWGENPSSGYEARWVGGKRLGGDDYN